MRKWVILLALAWTLLGAVPALGEDMPEKLIHEALLLTVDETVGDFGAEGHAVLGSEKAGREMRVYLYAVVCRYGFMGGYCVEQSGWSGPCTMVFHEINGEWRLKECLEVEDYSEIPQIMPKSAENRMMNGQFDSEKMYADLWAQIDENLALLGRDEPFGTYGEAGGKLPGVITLASNLLPFGPPDWPLGCTSLEREEEGTRVLCEKTWTPDPDMPDKIVTANADGSIYDWGGATGTITLTKTRMADGKLLETITARATLADLTVTFRDDFGSIQYVFPLVEKPWNEQPALTVREYEKPAVTKEGHCQADTAALDRQIDRMDGEEEGSYTCEGIWEVGNDERFMLLRDCSRWSLVHLTKQGDAWENDWFTDKLIPLTTQEVWCSFLPGTSETEYGRFSRAATDVFRISAGEESPSLWIEFSRDGAGQWQVDLYESVEYGNIAYLFDDMMLIKASSFASDDEVFFSPGLVNRRAEDFDPNAIFERREELFSLRYDFILRKNRLFAAAGLMDDYAYIAGAEAMYADLHLQETVSVYAYPAENAPRAANGKASMSLNGPFAVLCREGDWLLVFYEVNAGRYLTGYVNARDSETMKRMARFVPQGQFERRSTKAVREAPLMDDPISLSALCAVKKNASVTVLQEYGDLCYVEAQASGRTYRGYMEASAIAKE